MPRQGQLVTLDLAQRIDPRPATIRTFPMPSDRAGKETPAPNNHIPRDELGSSATMQLFLRYLDRSKRKSLKAVDENHVDGYQQGQAPD